MVRRPRASERTLSGNSAYRGSRRCVHTPEFKLAEKQFANYAEAKEALKQFVRREI